MSDLPILPTTVVGSHGKPGWWHACKDLHEQGDWGPYDLEELLSDAVDIAILDQERAGVDIITDGEARRLDGYVDGYYEIIDGIRALPVARKAGPWGYDQQTRYEAIGKIASAHGSGDCAGVYVSARPHPESHESHLCWPIDLRLAHSPQ